VFEPDRLIIDGFVRQGRRQGLRGITFAPEFPVREQATAGDHFALRVMGLGVVSMAMMPVALEAIRVLGSTVGLGPDHVRFALEESTAVWRTWGLHRETLPTQLGVGTVPWLRLNLETPLYLKQHSALGECENGQFGGRPRRPATKRRFTHTAADAPTLEGILRESIRTVRRAIAEFSDDGRTMEFDPGPLLDAAARVECLHRSWMTFRQSRLSARQDARWEPSGWHGQAIYRDVPLALLPWLTWAGHLGIGDSRNCGAGLWRLELG
jgi:hypothetical protein